MSPPSHSCRAAAAAAAASASTQPALQDTAMVESDDGRYVATVSGTEFLLDRRYESIRCVPRFGWLDSLGAGCCCRRLLCPPYPS